MSNPPIPLDFDALADVLDGQADDALLEAEGMFLHAAQGAEIRIADGEWIKFSGEGGCAIAWAIAHAIRGRREHGAPLHEQLERLSELVDEGLARTEQITAMEAAWKA